VRIAVGQRLHSRNRKAVGRQGRIVLLHRSDRPSHDQLFRRRSLSVKTLPAVPRLLKRHRRLLSCSPRSRLRTVYLRKYLIV
jgi:hypothetical protein